MHAKEFKDYAIAAPPQSTLFARCESAAVSTAELACARGTEAGLSSLLLLLLLLRPSQLRPSQLP